jgi:hypothetical protein
MPRPRLDLRGWKKNIWGKTPECWKIGIRAH